MAVCPMVDKDGDLQPTGDVHGDVREWYDRCGMHGAILDGALECKVPVMRGMRKM